MVRARRRRSPRSSGSSGHRRKTLLGRDLRGRGVAAAGRIRAEPAARQGAANAAAVPLAPAASGLADTIVLDRAQVGVLGLSRALLASDMDKRGARRCACEDSGGSVGISRSTEACRTGLPILALELLERGARRLILFVVGHAVGGQLGSHRVDRGREDDANFVIG